MRIDEMRQYQDEEIIFLDIQPKRILSMQTFMKKLSKASWKPVLTRWTSLLASKIIDYTI